MKNFKSKFISVFISTVCFLSVSPVSTGAYVKPGESFTLEKGPDHISASVKSGDVNLDSNVDITDLLILKSRLTGEDEQKSSAAGDLNFDGKINILDFIRLKSELLSGQGGLYEKKIEMSILDNPVPDYADKIKVITSLSEFKEYAESITDNKEKAEEITSQYDSRFFEENDLITEIIYQERGEGIFSEICDYFVVNYEDFPFKLTDEDGNKIKEDYTVIMMNSEYEHDKALYPVTNTYILTRISVPKNICNKYKPFVFDGLFPDKPGELLSFTSPDEKNSILIVQSSFLLVSNVCVYRENSDGSLTWLGGLSCDDGYLPFDNDGYWKTTEDGEKVFTNDKSYIFHWYEDRVEIEHNLESSKGELFTETIYF